MFDGDPARAPLIAEQDLAPEKPATDVIRHATAHAPDGKPLAEWPVRVRIPRWLDYGFHVRGPVQWRKSLLRGWHLSKPQPVVQVAIDYRLAFGGAAVDKVHQMNPAGRGFDPSQRTVPPQIGSLTDFRRKDPHQPMEVHGLGPIAKAWLPRRLAFST